MRLPILATALLLAACPRSGVGQEPVEPILEGRVLRAGDPLPGVRVTLHRVAADFAGEIDSVTADGGGRFAFVLPRLPDPEGRPEILFGSVRHQEILYFGPPVSEPLQLDSIYLIEVYDTVSAPPGGAPLPVEVRNIFLERDDTGVWRATDLFEVRNDGDRTLVAPEGQAVWSYPLPEGASDFEPGQSDLSPDAVSFRGGVLRISSPIPPGERLYVLRYSLPGPATSFPLPGATERMELLIREPAPPLDVRGLAATQPVELEPGSSYRRYSGEDLVDAQVEVVPGAAPRTLAVQWAAVVLALVLAAVGLLAFRRRRSPPEATAGSSRDDLLLRIARLDEEAERGGGSLPPEEHARRRKALLRELRKRG